MPNNLLFVEPHGFNLIPPETTAAHLGAAGSPYLSAGAWRDRRTRKRHEASQSADERSDRTLRTLGSPEQPETERLRQPGIDDFARVSRDIVFSPLIVHESWSRNRITRMRPADRDLAVGPPSPGLTR